MCLTRNWAVNLIHTDLAGAVRNLRPWPLWVITRRKLTEFWEQHADAETRLRACYQVVSTADWRSWDDVKRVFPSADLVGRFVVFNIGGNNYRVIARVEFKVHKVFVRYVLTHAEYSKGGWKHDPWI